MTAKASKTRQMSSLVDDRTSDYARRVISGEIIAGPHVRNACRRHFDDLERGSERGIWFDHDAAERAFRFFEGALRLSEGQFEGEPFRLHPSQAFIVGSLFGWKKQTGYRRFRRAYIEQGKGNGKALALDTPIPTPSGWTTMGELRVGDFVLDRLGKPTKIIAATVVMRDRPCYRVSFFASSLGDCRELDAIVADASHQWEVARGVPVIVTTEQLSCGDRIIGGSGEVFVVGSTELIAPVPVRCIQVDAPDSLFLAGRGMVPTHNSPLCGGVGIYGLAADGEAGSQVYAAAAKKDQANILFRDAVKMVQASPALAKRIAMSGGPGREYNMAYHANGSFFRPVSRDTGKSGSGPRPHFVLADEVHEMPDASILEILERGFKFRRQPLLVMITNSGSDRNSVAWNEREWAVRVAAGNREDNVDDGIAYVGDPLDDETFSYVCALDIGDDPLNDKSCWVKANPLLGVTITEEYLQGVVLQAKNIPSKQNNILRLHFCEWTDADVAWMSREVVEPLLADYCLSEHKGKQITLGVDLSRSRDITAMGCVVKTGEKNGKPMFDCWVEAWTPGDTMQQRSERDKLPYPLWAEQGHIHAPPGENINYRHVAQTVFEYNRDFDIRMIAYDRYAFRKFEDEVKELGLDLNFVEHPQGGTRKGRPTEDMIKAAGLAGREPEGLWFPSSLRLFEDAMLEGRVRLKRNPVLISAIMSAVLERDKWDNAWLSKQRSVNKIDAAVALVMAFGAAHAVAMDAKPDYNIHFFSIGR